MGWIVQVIYMKINRHRLLTYLSISILSFFSLPVFAYLDPGTGSLIIQGLLAALAATFVGLNHYWERVKSIFKKQQKPQHEDIDNKPE